MAGTATENARRRGRSRGRGARAGADAARGSGRRRATDGPRKGPEVFKQQARILKALANESRLMIVDRLASGECTVGELVALVGSDQSTVSKHLSVLRSHGIVEDRREGNYVYYRLVTRCVLNFFACASEVLEVRL